MELEMKVKNKIKEEGVSFFDSKYTGMYSQLLKLELDGDKAFELCMNFVNNLDDELQDNFLELLALEIEELKAKVSLKERMIDRLEMGLPLDWVFLRKLSFELHINYEEIETLAQLFEECKENNIEYPL